MARQKNNETREKILKNAYARFMEYGYESVYLRDIAEDSGITATLLHHYYPTKADIVIHIIYDLLQKFIEYMNEKLGPTGAAGNSYSFILAELIYMFDVLLRNNGRMLTVYSYVICDTKLMNDVVEYCLDRMAPADTVDTVEKRYKHYILWGGISQIVALHLKKTLPFEVRDGVTRLFVQYLQSLGMKDADIKRIVKEAEALSTQDVLDEFYGKYSASIDHFIYCDW